MIIRPKDKKEIIISGVFVTLSLILATVFVFMLSSESSLFATKSSIYTYMTNSQSLKAGSAVQLKGIKIGSVKNVSLSDLDKIKIEITVLDEFLPYIKEDSYIAVKTQGVLGDKFLEILGGTKDAKAINSEATIETREEGFMDKFLTRGEDILNVSARVLFKVDDLLSKIPGEKISNIFHDLEKTTASTQKILASIEAAKINSLLTQLDKLSTNMSSSSNALARITKQVEEGPGTLNSLIYDRALHDDMRTLLGGSNRNKVLKYFIRESIKNSDH
jgi:phospholipid/cholesterol/gamma-HCH transport system substrate-binding protein